MSLALALPVAFLLREINTASSGQPERAAMISGIFLLTVILVAPAIYLVKSRGQFSPAMFGSIVIACCTIVLAGVYLFSASHYLFLRGDFAIWSESDFVNDIIKFRTGYPLFSAEVNNESFAYTPGSQLLTYFLSGFSNWLPRYRLVQILYTVIAAMFAYSCSRKLLTIAQPDSGNNVFTPVWSIIVLSGLFLIATNSLTNPFSHLLHNDALAQLVTIAAFRLLIEYEDTNDARLIWLMALLPAFGFWVKQSLVIWAVIFAFYLLVFSRPRSFKRFGIFSAAAFIPIAVSLALGHYLWADDFRYWVFTVLGSHGVSPLRSLKHLFDVWLYVAIGIVGGAVLMNVNGLRKFFGLWLVWMGLILLEIYTSGVAWMLNHIGPGSLIAGTWFFASAAWFYSKLSANEIGSDKGASLMRALTFTAVICLLFSGLGVVRIPVQPFAEADAERYVSEIETEFKNSDPGSVLLDFGSWVYFENEVVMKDRAPSIGERGYSATGDFSGILARITEKKYSKILLRNFHSGDFWYDHEMWKKPSGIREALRENYREVKQIEPIEMTDPKEMPYGFSKISILVPVEN